MSQGSDNFDSANSGSKRRPLFQRNGSFNQGSSQFSKFKPHKDNRSSHSPQQSRHNLIDGSLGVPRIGGKNGSNDALSEGGGNSNQRNGATTPIVRKSSFYG